MKPLRGACPWRARHALGLLFLGATSLHCTPFSAVSTIDARAACGQGARDDSAKTARIVTLLSQEASALALTRKERFFVCFGAGLGRGVISGDVVYLDASERDAELAAQLGHLLVHHRDRLGDGCAAGIDAARASEARAAKLEQNLRMHFGIPAPMHAPTQDYAHRCAQRRFDGDAI